MKNDKSNELRQEYSKQELGKGVRGKYYKEYMKGTNLVLLSPEVASVFPNDKAVNDTLKKLIRIAKESVNSAK